MAKFGNEVIHIPIKDSEFNSICLIDSETGKEFVKIKNIEDMEVVDENAGTEDEIDIRKFYSKKETAFSLKEPMLNIEMLCETIGIDLSDKPDAYDIQFQKLVQARKHKKRRINKKWLKRYGYKTILVDAKGWKMRTNTDGTVEFIKE